MNRKLKETYISPVMECTQIEAEGTFAGSVVDDDGKGTKVETVQQDYHSFDLSNGDLTTETGDKVITWE